MYPWKSSRELLGVREPQVENHCSKVSVLVWMRHKSTSSTPHHHSLNPWIISGWLQFTFCCIV